ncbi:hypothetical protein [Nitrosomonas mobilis]|uniref:WD40 repeat domain-containing protein n=1 Tax=Nitrosomonas mobilis TaxID=51642 RepID=UPI00316AE678
MYKGEAYLYDAKTFEQLLTFSPVFPVGDLYDELAQFSPDGSKIMVISGKSENGNWNGSFARIWDAVRGKELAVIGPHKNLHYSAFVGKGDRVMTAGGSFIRFWNTENGAPLVEIRVREGDGGVVRATASPDGSLVAAGNAWSRAAVWDTHTGDLVTELKGARENTNVHGFTLDGQYVVTSDDVGTIGLWHPRSGQLIRTIHGPEVENSLFNISVSGRYLLASSNDLTLRLWDIETGSLLFLTDLEPYWTKKVNIPKRLLFPSSILRPTGNQVLAHIAQAEPGLVFDLPYKNFEEVIEAAYAAVPYRFTNDERKELVLDLFGRPDPRVTDFELLTADVRR